MSGQAQLPLAAATGGLTPVAAYVRMSTEHQQYSTENQLDRIKEYAASRGMQIVRVFADEGKSGLSVKGRESLRRMIAEVEHGKPDFKSILAYDVSRWGRFQDADESGYYEYICKRAGINVHYCAEQFENDGSPTSNIIKSVKRSMAGEYSRELSTKVFQGACRLIQLGFKQGGAAGFGLRRVLIDQAGKAKGTLKIGEHKSLQTDRVVLMPGPDDEQKTVRWIYRAFLDEAKTEREIADASQCPEDPHRSCPALDARDGASSSHQRKIHRQQRLSPHVLQIEAQACPESAGDVDSGRPRISRRCRSSDFREGAGSDPRASETLFR